MSERLGVIRNLSYKYGKIKQQINENNLYKQNPSLNDSSNGFMSDNRKTGFIPQDNPHIELSNWHHPPKFVDIYINCNDLFQQLTIKYADLQEEQQKRIVPNFNESETAIIDNKIYTISQNITIKLKQCEKYIKDIKFVDTNSTDEEQIKENMRINLASKLSGYTRQLQLNQEAYCKRYKELNGDDDDLNYNESHNKNMFMQTQIENKRSEHMQERNKEINQIVKSISDLAQIFNEVQTLVLESGTILDRIDYNIEEARTHVGNAKKELIKAENSMTSNCVRNVNMCLISWIFLMGLLIIFKIMKY